MGKSNPQIRAAALWPLLIPILLLLPGIAMFPYQSPDATYSDITITHYPNAIFLKRSILEWAQIPLWSPTILSGYPFAANPLSGLWYPPGWLASLFPLPLGLNLMVMLHLLLGALGMYLLIRKLDQSHEAAIFGALAFELLPKVLAHYGAGHLTMVYAIAWTPWLLLAESSSPQRSGSFWLRQPGIILALIALADPRWAVYSGLFWLSFSLIENVGPWLQKITTTVQQTLLALLLASPLLLPLIEYSQLSTRAKLSPTDLLAFSLPPAGLLGLLSPQFGGPHEWVVYLGVAIFALALFRILSTTRQRIDWFWIAVAIIALFFSLGENIPGIAQIAGIPGLSLLRVPPRVLPLAGFSLIMLAAGSLDALLNNRVDSETRRPIRLVLVGLLGLQVALALVIWQMTSEIPVANIWSLSIALVFGLGIFLLSTKRLGPHLFWIGLVLVTLFDLVVVDQTLFAPRAKEKILAEGAEVASFLAQQPGQFRVYSPSYSLPQQTAEEYGLELADGVDPLQSLPYVDFMEDATGVESIGYSITLPPFANSDPANDNRTAVPDLSKLALLNVAYVASEFAIDIDGLDLVASLGSTNVYEIEQRLPRAYIAGAPDQPVAIIQWTPNRIEILAEGPGRLVLSEIVYPGWVAIVDGKQFAIEPYEQILRSVALSEGSHEVVFEFRPLSVYAGLIIFLLASGVLAVAERRQRK